MKCLLANCRLMLKLRFSVALKHLQEVPLQPIEINPDIPESVNYVVMKAMQKDVNNRYSSATEMNNDLQEILKIQKEVWRLK